MLRGEAVRLERRWVSGERREAHEPLLSRKLRRRAFRRSSKRKKAIADLDRSPRRRGEAPGLASAEKPAASSRRPATP
jgi:hypothetical protein